MKKTAKLCLLFSLTFTLFYAASLGVSCLSLWEDVTRALPAKVAIPTSLILSELQKSLVFTLFFTLLLSVNYGCRTKTNGFASFIMLFALSFVFTGAVSYGISRVEVLDPPPITIAQKTPGKAGLVLFGNGVTYVMIDDPRIEAAKRVTLVPGNGLVYHSEPRDENGAALPVPALNFNTETSPLFRGIERDIKSVSEEFQLRFSAGLKPFALFLGATIFLLLSIAFVFASGNFALANILFGAIFFRLVLMFQVFLKESGITERAATFIGEWFPSDFASPFILALLGSLLTLHSILVYASRKERREVRHA